LARRILATGKPEYRYIFFKIITSAMRGVELPRSADSSGRRRRLRLPRHWPWADQIVEAFRRIMIITAPT
jgi:hypothetical protein